jgi:tetratricopeptide (TPR) repeat protein
MQSTLERVLALRGAAEAGRLRALTLMAQGHLASGDLPATDETLRIVAASSSPLDQRTLRGSLDVRARLSYFRSEYSDAEQMFRKNIDLAFALGDAFEFVKSSYFLGITLANLGRISEALEILTSAADMAKRNGENFWLSRMPNAFGWIHRELQDFEEAEAFDRQGAAISRRTGYGEAEVNSVINLAFDRLHSNDEAAASSVMKSAESLLSQDAWFRWRFEIRWLHARAEQTLAMPDAMALLEKATHYSARKYVVIARTLLARIALLSADLAGAAQEIDAACAILQRYPAPLGAWRTYSIRGRIELQRGNSEAGVTAYKEAASVIRYISDHINDPRLRRMFLSSDAIRAVLREANEQICTQ